MSRPVCAIVGAGEGLGRALAAKFATQGFDIALISRSEANCVAAIEAARTASDAVEVRFYSADATNPEILESALSAVARDLDEIDVLIYPQEGTSRHAHHSTCPMLRLKTSTGWKWSGLSPPQNQYCHP